MACVSPPTHLDFVDEAGQSVAAKGQFRDRQGTRPFDCADAPKQSVFDFGCTGGTLTIPADTRDAAGEVRFVRDDGSFGDWQRISITSKTQTDEDFNGVGCPCSWVESKTEPLLVPEDARNPLRQPLLDSGGAPADP